MSLHIETRCELLRVEQSLNDRAAYRFAREFLSHGLDEGGQEEVNEYLRNPSRIRRESVATALADLEVEISSEPLLDTLCQLASDQDISLALSAAAAFAACGGSARVDTLILSASRKDARRGSDLTRFLKVVGR